MLFESNSMLSVLGDHDECSLQDKQITRGYACLRVLLRASPQTMVGDSRPLIVLGT